MKGGHGTVNNAPNDNAVRIFASVRKSEKNRSVLHSHILQFIIAMLCCCGSIFSLISCMNMNVSSLKIFLVITFTLLFCMTMRSKGRLSDIIMIISAVGLSSAVLIFRDKICGGFAVFLNTYKAISSKEYRETPLITLIEPELAEVHLEIFLIMAAITICLVFGILTIKSDAWVSAAVTMIFPIVFVMLIGLEPNGFAFSMYVVSFAALLTEEISCFNNISEKRFVWYGSQNVFTAIVTSGLTLAVIFGAVKLFGYERPEKLNQIYEKACKYVDSGELEHDVRKVVSSIIPLRETGAINHGKLHSSGSIYFDFIPVLRVTMPASEDSVYLRGFIGSVYTGNSWEELSDGKLRELEEITSEFENSELSPLLLDGYNLKYAPSSPANYSFTVKNIDAGKDVLYMPYNLVPESVSRYEIIDGSHFEGGDETWFGQIYDPNKYHGYQHIFRQRWSIPSVLLNDEAAYRRFVYENYLDLPDEFDPTIMFTENYYEYITAEEVQTGKSTLDEMTVFSRKLYFIRTWLRDNCEYSLETEPLSRGEDFINHFLEQRKGSCSHFASTAVMMCRYAGIPARYVEGYVIKPSDTAGTAPGTIVTVDVDDSRGHAWVEIYIDGYGWYPLEFTSGYGNVRTAIPTETTVAETEETTSESVSETEISSSSAEITETLTPATQPAETEITIISENVDESAQTVTEVTLETHINDEITLPPESPSPSVGFGFFGIKGENKVDVWYDLTWVLVMIAVILTVPTAFLLRRRIIISHRRRLITPEDRVSAEYKRFCRILTLMEMPPQEDMGYSEYAKELSRKSPLLADGNAEFIISAALKSSFGGGRITVEESREMQTTVTSLAKRFYRTASAFTKFKIKFIYCIL